MRLFRQPPPDEDPEDLAGHEEDPEPDFVPTGTVPYPAAEGADDTQDDGWVE